MGKPKILNINYYKPGSGPQRRQHNLEKPWRRFFDAFLGPYEDHATWEEALRAQAKGA